MSLSPTPGGRITAIAAAAALALSLSACTPAPAAPVPSKNPNTWLPDAHVHGLSVNRATGQIFLATHDGLYDASKNPAVKIGPSHDLMGFTATKDNGVFYASGHPAQGTGQTNPLGLIKSVDSGKTWQNVSRQGESDFHALTATESGIVAFDGALRISPDGKSWTSVPIDFTPAALAGNADSNTVLATTPDGVRRSTDGGATWTLDKSSPIIQFASLASALDAIGAAPDGTLYRSADGGTTWKPTGKLSAPPQAIAATVTTGGPINVWAATSRGLEASTNGGTTFVPYSPTTGATPNTFGTGEGQ